MCNFSEAAPVFVKKLKDQKIRDGDTVILTCSVEGEPRPQITWYRNGTEILDNQVSPPLHLAFGDFGCVEVWPAVVPQNPEFTETCTINTSRLLSVCPSLSGCVSVSLSLSL